MLTEEIIWIHGTRNHNAFSLRLNAMTLILIRTDRKTNNNNNRHRNTKKRQPKREFRQKCERNGTGKKKHFCCCCSAVKSYKRNVLHVEQWAMKSGVRYHWGCLVYSFSFYFIFSSPRHFLLLWCVTCWCADACFLILFLFSLALLSAIIAGLCRTRNRN